MSQISFTTELYQLLLIFSKICFFRHYKVNEVSNFFFTKQKDVKNSDITKMWLERTHLNIGTKLPGKGYSYAC